MKKITIIIPLKDEEGNIDELTKSLKEIFDTLPYIFNVLFIDDGSTDKTSILLKKNYKCDKRFGYILLSRNFGHQNALKSGIDGAEGDAVIMMDGDMQHPIEVIAELLQKFEDGYDVVNTCRIDPYPATGSLKNWTSHLFYKQLNKLSDIKIPYGSADFRLLSDRALREIKRMDECDLFYRGLVLWVGFKQTTVKYKSNKRFSGATKYTLVKMFSLALDGITSFSVKPLSIAVYIGFTVALLSLLYIPYVLYSLISGHAVLGWASIIVTVSFLGGLQLVVLGIIGIYIGRIFIYSKGRPHYIIKESTLEDIKVHDEKIYHTAEF